MIKKRELLILLMALSLIIIFIGVARITGNVINDFGPSQQEQNCLMSCMNCSSPGVGCTGNQASCMQQCNVVKPEQTSEEVCVETCAKQGCGEYDFSCQKANQEKCDKQCGMVKEPEAKSEEESCIRNCVEAKSPGTICQASQEGEIGGGVCQECAKSCEHLYEGPCLNEEKLEAAKKECETCEHCYGEPLMGDSGEGWECIVSVECKDASSQFGDDSGTGEGITAKIGDAISNTISAIGEFFSNLF
jgi:hypothetical protein